ncbi:Cut9-interacting protein scn1 [Paraconiothyrium brasiliense]|uniref:Cut9-interacting protein scn1 n=1 Tax=Paraconiothyrium brasiliense TaxID=300254 RepID=A0ABR3RUA1_9PLEO
MSTHKDDFPWHIGVYDAHCHPTDIMSSIPSIPSMKARCLTVMGTRAQDQDLVSQVADQYGIKNDNHEAWKREECMVPCFGWHPWFAHMMYLEHPSGPEGEGTGERPEKVLQDEDKIKHYQNVLAPRREDPSEEDKKTYLSLPDPTPFSVFLSQTRKNLAKYPYALVGEIGLDRSFRIPEAFQTEREENEFTPGGREGRRLTPFRCAPAHQKEIFRQQLMLAAEMNRAVSVHGVQAHGLVFDTIKELWKDHQRPVLSKREKKKRGKDDPSVESQLASSQKNDGEPKPYPPRICLHSYSGSPDAFKQYLNPAIPVAFFASFSTAINLGDAVGEETPQSFVDMIRTVPDDMVLVESDLHTAGNEMDRRLEDIVRRICKIKGWDLEEGAERLGRNWRRFVFGTEG